MKDRFIILPASNTHHMDKKIAFAFLYILLFPVLLLLISGDFAWTEGWIFSIWFLVLCYSTILYLYQNDPALLEERYRQPGTGNQETWDRYVVYGLVIGFVAWIVIMPLDAKRFGWSPLFHLWLKVAGGAGLVGSFFLFFRSYTDNTFLSPLVRIQEDRKQRVVSTGVYGFVRHPMYLGGILMFLGTPLLLGSSFGVIAGLALTILLMARVAGEEKCSPGNSKATGNICRMSVTGFFLFSGRNNFFTISRSANRKYLKNKGILHEMHRISGSHMCAHDGCTLCRLYKPYRGKNQTFRYDRPDITPGNTFSTNCHDSTDATTRRNPSLRTNC